MAVDSGDVNGDEATTAAVPNDGAASTAATTTINGVDSPPSEYPDLSREARAQRDDYIRNSTYAKSAWEAGGVRFAPVRVPLVRRLQTGAVLFHSMSIVMFVSAFWFTCTNPLAWPLLLAYLIHLSVSTAATDGNLSYRSEYLRSLPLWRLFAGYFPAELHRTHQLDPSRRYIMGYHPHGIISHGAWLSFATNALGFAAKFPGITNSLLTLDSNFRLPFYRDWLLLLGIRSVSKESIANTLSKGGNDGQGQGRAVTIVIGGARESLEAQPGKLRLILRDRKGFVKMALRTGADLVPVLSFGENDLYDQLSAKQYPVVHHLQMFILKVFKFTLPAMHGRGVLNYDVGLMPYRHPVNIVVGKPIRVEGTHGAHPSQEEIDRLHGLYVIEVQRLWDTYKDEFAKDRTAEMEII
ncbi:2-acylglycerol O-acyltransferase 2 [Geosmithia morbida]|uniref:Diacylglycerol O-acyltransferase n=1 Tax=Geosmithia morbida TaxID=1094350 RepID=A0A9P5D532_9HYPO|nr:2-acylglycerol O-acyltransferase 2 [Geosmithia morbida]KAF4123365.1 2-acylglycerol O-acyltransferase 2 [Geosmithia morbida]